MATEVSPKAVEVIKKVLKELNDLGDELPSRATAAVGLLAAIIGYGGKEKKESLDLEQVGQAIFMLDSSLQEAEVSADVIAKIKSLIKALSDFLRSMGYYGYYGYGRYYGTKPKATEKKESRALLEGGRLIEAAEGAEGLEWAVEFIKAGESANRRLYSPEVLEAAVPLFEGVQFFTDHPTRSEAAERPERSVMDLAGWCDNAHWDEARKAICGTLHVLSTHPFAERCREAYERGNPDLFGLSIRGNGRTRLDRRDGRIVEVVESITNIRAVEAVTLPAAGGRFRELLASEGEGDMDILERLTVEELAKIRPDLVEALRAEKQEREAEPEGPTEAASEPKDAALEEARKVYDEVRREIRLMRCEQMLESALSEAELPSVLKDQLRKRFSGRVFEPDELREAVKEQKDIWAQAMQSVRPASSVRVTQDERDKIAKAVQGMILEETIDGIPPFRSLHQAYCIYNGIDPWNASPSAIASAILNEARQHPFDSGLQESITTTGWAQVFGDSITRRLVKEYRIPLFDEWRQIVSDVRPLKDLRSQRIVRIGHYGTLPSVAAGGTYQSLTSPADEEATYSPSKYGGLEDYTWEALVNDDLGALRAIPRKLALAAKITLYQFVFDFLADNGAIYDGVALFHADHANIGSSALSSDALTSAKIAMRSQAALSSSDTFLGIRPKYLVVPNELEATALQLRNSDVEVTADKDATVANPHKNSFDVIVVDYWTDANNWYLAADPQLIPTIEVGFLNGRDEPELFTEVANSGSHFTADKIVFKIRFVFGGAVVDYRGFYGAIVS